MHARRIRRLGLGVALALGAAAAVAWLREPGPAQAQEQRAVFVSGLQAGRGNLPIVRIHSVAESFADTYQVLWFVRDPTSGALVNPTNTPRSLFPGRVIELDLNATVALVNPDYRGPIQFVASATGGTFHAFGPETVRVEAVQKEGKAVWRPVVRWTP